MYFYKGDSFACMLLIVVDCGMYFSYDYSLVVGLFKMAYTLDPRIRRLKLLND